MDDLATLPMWVWVAIAVPLVIALCAVVAKTQLTPTVSAFDHAVQYQTARARRKTASSFLEQLQILDQVTGVFNRKHLEDRLEEAFFRTAVAINVPCQLSCLKLTCYNGLRTSSASKHVIMYCMNSPHWFRGRLDAVIFSAGGIRHDFADLSGNLGESGGNFSEQNS